MIRHKKVILMTLGFLIGLSVLFYPALSNYWNSKTQSEAIVDYEAMLAAYKPEDYTLIFEEEYSIPNFSASSRPNPSLKTPNTSTLL